MSESKYNPAFEAMFDHSSLGIIICDHQGTIENANAFANRIFGYDDGELIGQKIETLVPQKVRHNHTQHRHHFNNNPKARAMGQGMDLQAVKKDGNEIPVEISLGVFETLGSKHIVSFISDITERKKIERELKKLNTELEAKVKERTQELSQAILELQHVNASLEKEMEQRKKTEAEARQAFEKEKELNELKSRFVSMASHEFRTPLGGILSSASLIDRYHQPQDEPKRKKHISTIKNAVQSLTTILNDFLSLDKLEQGETQCRPTDFIISEFVKDLVSEMEGLAQKNQEIIYQHQGSEDQVVLDQDMLRNLLINLLSNALKYSRDSQDIEVTTCLDHQELTIIIKDKGIGIPLSDQKHLFKRFFRAHNATTIQGTGLGLNIVKRYLDMMGGSISFVSEENEGTTFSVKLPREIKL